MRPPEMELRQKCHAYIVKKDQQYKSFESIHMNETTGLVTIRWIDRYNTVQENRVPYGIMR